ncbi:semaphorin-7A-like [Xiphias gladius]|uniref:semaphorin-7A-like n=1 Tax=Xiphias gladius TaxID=8245 RepID=UPI001A981E43|nr:semaphorin-7A-like [Xiphias gladius]
MQLLLLTWCLLFPCLGSSTAANKRHLPRMIFTEKETAVKRLPSPGHHTPLQILLNGQPDTVTAAGQTHLYSYNFQDHRKTPVERKVLWKECIDSTPRKDCSYNITVFHKREEANQAFVCGTNGRETLCCDVNLSELSPKCMPSAKMGHIKRSIGTFIIKKGEPSALVESAESADLYITYSGSQANIGIYRFGKDRVRPVHHNKEQHYVGLMLSRRPNSLEDKVYAFYKEKNRDTSLQSDTWLPFVTQVCMADVGGPKNNLQFSWTSQMNARLFCGDPDNGQYFSELVDVATVHADQWQDARVYALFRNEWGMSAVCVYTIEDIDHIFSTSPFKGSSTANHKKRSRMCVSDSTKIPPETLRMIEKTSEMEQWVQPVNKSGPLLFNHHNYTHIYVHTSQDKRNHPFTVLFLSTKNGGLHKVIQTKSQIFVIAEYQPIFHQAHIFSIILHPSSRKLYVESRSELIQLDVANCAKYGDSCEECVLARDPYCGWNGTHCTAETHGTLQDVVTGNHTICSVHPEKAFRYSHDTLADENVDRITLPSRSRYFLQCPVSSHHAQYTWRHLESSIPCRSKDQECLLLIDSIGPEQVGDYRCVSEELGYSKVLAQYQLQLESRAAGRLSSSLVWVCLMAALIKSLSC